MSARRALLLLAACCALAMQTSPAIFGAGTISLPDSHDDYLTLSPDGLTAVFTRLEAGYRGGTLYLADRAGDQWTNVRVAPFSGAYEDSRPSFSPDGRRVFFASNRPHDDREDGRRDLDIWYAERTDDGWEEAERLTDRVNSPAHETHPSVTLNNTLYFVRRRDDSDIWLSPFRDGDWRTPIMAPGDVNSPRPDSHVFVDPQERFLLFARIDQTSSGDHDDIYISVRGSGGWTTPVNVGAPVNTPHYDYSAKVFGDTLYFTRNGQWTDGPPADIYMVAVSAVPALAKAIGR